MSDKTKYPQTKTVCQLDDNHFFIGTTEADLSPLDLDDGVYLMPAGSIDTTPPKLRKGFVAKWMGDNWQYIPDHRGEIVYSTIDQTEIIISEVGDYPENTTLLKPPSANYQWDKKTKKWEMSAEKQTALIQQRKTELLQRIANKTDNFKAQYLVGYSQAEIDSFYRQEREARNELPTMLLTEIFEGRDDLNSIEDLKKKVIEKADLFAIIMGKLFAIKQGFEKHIEQAETAEQLDKIEQEINQWQKL